MKDLFYGTSSACQWEILKGEEWQDFEAFNITEIFCCFP